MKGVRARRVIARATAGLAAALAWAPPVLADDGLGQQQVVWLPDGPGGRTAAGQFVCRAGPVIGGGDGSTWSTIQSFPSGYATGNCSDNWHLRRTRKEVNPAYTWDGGYVYGDYEGCGWMRSDRAVMIQDLAAGACSNPSRRDAAIAYVIDCHHGTPGCAGTRVLSTATCPEYVNVRPWSAAPAPTSGPIRTRGAGYALFDWRYVVRGRGWVMVRDNGVPAGQANWVFVPRSCLPSRLPANPRDPNGKYFP